MVAERRSSNTDDLGLEKPGIEMAARGFIPVDDELRTQVDGTGALREANARGGFTHTKCNDFSLAPRRPFNIADDLPRP